MFTTETNLKFICQDVHLFGDGTFQYCAKFFHQLYTLHAYKNGQYVPCVFFLLPSKSKECYVSMFKHLLDSCARYNLSLNVCYIHLDFEVAVHDAAKEFWPDVSIKAGQFHLSQAWYRKIQNLGLSPEYQNHESKTGQWLKNFFGLCILHPAEVEDCFVYDIMSKAPDCEKALVFADYVLKFYIESSAKFSPII